MSHLSKRRMMLNLYAKFFGFTTTQAEQLVGCLNHGDVAMGLCLISASGKLKSR